MGKRDEPKPVKPMSQKELVDTCAKLAELVAARLDTRRQYEMRFSFGIWATLIAAIAYFRVDYLPVGIGIAVLIAYALFLSSIFNRNVVDTDIFWNYFNQIQDVTQRHGIARVVDRADLRVGAPIQSGAPLHWLTNTPFSFASNWAYLAHFALTAALVAMAYLICANEVTWWELQRLATSEVAR